MVVPATAAPVVSLALPVTTWVNGERVAGSEYVTSAVAFGMSSLGGGEATRRFQADTAFVLEAIQQHGGWALRHAPGNVRVDKNVVL